MGTPDQVPGFAVSVPPTAGVPEMLGAAVLDGAEPTAAPVKAMRERGASEVASHHLNRLGRVPMPVSGELDLRGALVTAQKLYRTAREASPPIPACGAGIGGDISGGGGI